MGLPMYFVSYLKVLKIMSPTLQYQSTVFSLFGLNSVVEKYSDGNLIKASKDSNNFAEIQNYASRPMIAEVNFYSQYMEATKYNGSNHWKSDSIRSLNLIRKTSNKLMTATSTNLDRYGLCLKRTRAEISGILAFTFHVQLLTAQIKHDI